MDELAKPHFDHECISFKSVCGTGAKQITFDKVPLDRATEYAAEDADITLRLWQRLKPRIASEGVTRVYEMVDRPLVATIGRMERRGIKVDRDYLAKLSGEFATEIARARSADVRSRGRPVHDRLAAATGRGAVRPARPQGRAQGQERRLFDRRHRARAARRRRRRVRAAGARLAAVVQAEDRPTPTRCRRRSTPRRAASTPASAWRARRPGGCRSTDPNLQNIPIRTEIGRQIRDAFVAEPGHVLMSADYSQIELRLAAHMADVPALKEAFRARRRHPQPDRDRAVRVGRPRQRATRPRRSISRSSTASRRWGLAGRLGVARDEGQAIIDRYFERFPGIRNYIDDDADLCSRERLHRDAVRPQNPFPQHRQPPAESAPGQRTRGDQRADPGDQRRSDQARDGPDG